MPGRERSRRKPTYSRLPPTACGPRARSLRFSKRSEMADPIFLAPPRESLWSGIAWALTCARARSVADSGVEDGVHHRHTLALPLRHDVRHGALVLREQPALGHGKVLLPLAQGLDGLIE